eukprot:scaffold101015_cov71-Phaeocystis_antarctica.AAC.1
MSGRDKDSPSVVCRRAAPVWRWTQSSTGPGRRGAVPHASEWTGSAAHSEGALIKTAAREGGPGSRASVGLEHPSPYLCTTRGVAAAAAGRTCCPISNSSISITTAG